MSHRDVDLLIYTPAEFGQLRDQRWMRTILKEGKVIYESTCEPSITFLDVPEIVLTGKEKAYSEIESEHLLLQEKFFD